MGEDNQNFFDITLQPIINDTYLLDFEQQLDELSKKKIKISAGIILQDDAGKKKTDDAIKQIRALSKFDKKYDTQASIKIDVQGLDKQIDSVIEKIKNIDKEIVFKPKISDIELPRTTKTRSNSDTQTKRLTNREDFNKVASKIGKRYNLSSPEEFTTLNNFINTNVADIDTKNFKYAVESIVDSFESVYNYAIDTFELINDAKTTLGADSDEFRSFISSLPKQSLVPLEGSISDIQSRVTNWLIETKEAIDDNLGYLSEDGIDISKVSKYWEAQKDALFSIDNLSKSKSSSKSTTGSVKPQAVKSTKQVGTFEINTKDLEQALSKLNNSVEKLNNSFGSEISKLSESINTFNSNINTFSNSINDKVNNFVLNSNIPEEWKETTDSKSNSIRLRALFNTLDKNYKKVMESNGELQKSVGKNLLDITDEQLNAVYETYNSLVDKTVTLDFNVLNSDKISEVKSILSEISKLDKTQVNSETQEPEKKALKKSKKTTQQIVPSTEEALALRNKAKSVNIPTPVNNIQQNNISEVSELYNKLVDKVVTVSIVVPEDDVKSLLALKQTLDSFNDKTVKETPKKLSTNTEQLNNKNINSLAQKIESLTNALSDKTSVEDVDSNSVLNDISNTLDSMLDVQTQIRDYIYNTSNFSVSDLSEQSANSLLDAINSFSDKISSMNIGDESIQKLVDAINQNNTKSVKKNPTKNPTPPQPPSVDYNRTDTSYRSTSISSQAQSSADALSKVISGKSGFSVSSQFINETDIKSELDKLEQIARNAANIKNSISLEKTNSLLYDQLNEKLIGVNNNLTGLESELSNTTSNEKINKIIDMANAFDELNDSTSKLETKLADIRNEIKKYEGTTIDTSELSQIAGDLEDRLKKANDEKDEIKNLNVDSGTNVVKYIADMKSVSAETSKAVDDANNRFESIIPQINERKTLYDMKSGNNEIFDDIKRIQKLINSVKSSGIDPEKFIVNEGTNKSLSEAETLLNSFKEKLDSIDENSFDATMKKDLYDNYITPIKELMSYLDAANEKLSNLKSENKYSKSTAASVNAGIDLNKRIEAAKAALIKWGESNNKALRDSEFKNQYNAFLERLNSGTMVNATDLKKYNEELQIFKNKVVAAGKAGKTAGNLFLEMYKKFGGWTLVTKTMGQVIRLLKDMYTQTRAVDTAMTNLRKVTDASNQELNKYLTNASSNAIQIGVSLTDYIDATSQFSRLGYNLDQSEELGNLATIYKTVAEDLDINTASQNIISTLNAYKNFGIQAQEIVDQFNYVGNNFSISSAGIGEALQRSAASLAASNTSLTKSIALITAGNTIVQDVDKMGTQLKTISARIRGASSELGEDSEEIAISTSKLQKSIKDITGVDIMVSPTQFKDIYQIFDELSMVWDKLEDTDQAAIAEMLGGKTGLNVVQAIISNFQTARDVYTELEGGLAEGSATKELETALDSVDGKLNQLTATWQKLSNDTLNSEAVKGVIDSLRTLLSILDGIVETSKSLGVSAWGLGTFATTMIAQNVVRSKTGSGRVKMFTLNKYARISPGGNTERVYSVIVL